MPLEHPAPRRVIYFDVLRVLATFAVIVLHLLRAALGGHGCFLKCMAGI